MKMDAKSVGALIQMTEVSHKKEVAMLTVTESAKQHLKETLLAHSDDPENSQRIA